ncbi:MAG: hypothetical protein PF689_01425 [Deltaproteobacteria bacterium]|nr:hypothetical protein [Deltaproteobacteria bacterium]
MKNRTIFLSILCVLLLGSFFSSPSEAEDKTVDNILKRITPHLSGHALLGAVKQGDLNTTLENAQGQSYDNYYHFNGLVNFGSTFKIAEDIYFGHMLHAGSGGDYLGFKADDKVVITDLYIQFDNFLLRNLSLTTGSYDIPFGEMTWYLTNNAYSIKNPFVANSLFYSMLGGNPVGTTNTVGLKAEYKTKNWGWLVSLSNGAQAGASNEDGNFALIGKVDLHTAKFYKISINALHSDQRQSRLVTGDISDKLDMNNMISGGLLDLHLDFKWRPVKLSFKGYGGWFRIADTANTSIFYTAMAQIKATFWEKTYFALRASFWLPEDTDGDGQGISTSPYCVGHSCVWPSLINEPGISSPVMDQRVVRWQAAAGYWLKDNIKVKLSGFFDQYQYNKFKHNFYSLLLSTTFTY